VRPRAIFAAIALLLLAASGDAQAPVRRLTTIDALRQYPGYFHLQNVLVHGEFAESGPRIVLRANERDIRVILNDQKTVSGLAEVRGTFVDIGRLEADDPRVPEEYRGREGAARPRPGEELVLNVTGILDGRLQTTTSTRALALQPWRFEGQQVTVVGQFRGRNLFGDLPAAPGTSRYDFVLRSADTAVWVTGLRPRGRGFELNVDARVDTGRWLQVTGTVSQERGLVMSAGTALMATTAPAAAPPSDELAAPAAPPDPAEVVFNTPTDSEIDVASTGPVRVQFSRGLDPSSITGQIRVSYVGEVPPDVPPIEFKHTYDAANRALEIRFARPLDRFRTVKVELLEGIKTFDGALLKPWSVTFSIGGN
jgi:hypothetical protein